MSYGKPQRTFIPGSADKWSHIPEVPAGSSFFVHASVALTAADAASSLLNKLAGDRADEMEWTSQRRQLGEKRKGAMSLWRSDSSRRRHRFRRSLYQPQHPAAWSQTAV